MESIYSGFYKLSIEDRIKFVKEFSNLTDEDVNDFKNELALSEEKKDRMIENVIGGIQIPIGLAVNFLVNGKDYVVPMATEEPSVVAAASHAAKLSREAGGIFTSNSGSIMMAQVQLGNVKDPYGAKHKLYENKERILELANEQDPILVKLGGGARDIEVRVLDDIVVMHLVVDVKDAMGANAVNTMAEALAPLIEEITDSEVRLRILTNYADKRIVRARTVVKKEVLGGEEIVDKIVNASNFASKDSYRAATHNKGIMNGITAVVLATGNDTRAIEAGAHAYASKTGRYTTLSKWEKDINGDLVGTLELPMAVGLVGGATTTHPTSKACVKILGVKTALELAEIICATGLAQNLAAVKVLATEGVQRGHMALHSKNIAINAGAKGDEIDKVSEIMVKEKKVRIDFAKEILEELRG